MLDPADRTWGPALGEENKEASIVTIRYFLLSPNGKGHKSLSSSHSCSRQGNNREGVLRGQKLEWRTLASRSTRWLILKVNTIAWGDSNDQLRKWHSSHPNQMRPPRLGSQPETLSAEQPNLQQSWNSQQRSLRRAKFIQVAWGAWGHELQGKKYEWGPICMPGRETRKVPMADDSQQSKREISLMLIGAAAWP